MAVTTSSDHDMLASYEEEEEEEEGDDEGIVEQGEDSLAFFKPLMSKEKTERLAFLETLKDNFMSWSTRAFPPSSPSPSLSSDPKALELLNLHLPTVLRLSLTCPFDDVRHSLKTLLVTLKDSGVTVPRVVFEGPSSFVPKTELAGYGEKSKQVNHELQQLYENAFLRDARLSNMVQCLSDHPQYLDLFIQSVDFVMNGDGPVNPDIRYYIAILASSRHKCSYLVTYLEMEFKARGGNPLWLEGIRNIPKKLHNLLPLNKTLCHQPWYMSEDHFKALLMGPDSWSVAELVHAVVIMAYFHTLAGFCLGCGLNPEIDTELGHVTSSDQSDIPCCTNPALGVGGGSDSEPSSEPLSPASSPPSVEVSKYLVQHYIETSDTPQITKKLADTIQEKLVAMSQEEEEEEELEKDRQFAESVSSFGMELKLQSAVIPTRINLFKYLTDSTYQHEDFTLTSACTLRAREYSWEDHGFSFLNSLYPLLSELLDDKFKVTAEMTYRHVGEIENIDTKPFREATWYYIQSIKGIRHDDYNYGKVNKVLEIEYKTYIRMVACFPEKVTCHDFAKCMDGLQYSEKVHVNILVMEARLQAELIYALKALMSHMK